jgi:hypothetical protein
MMVVFGRQQDTFGESTEMHQNASFSYLVRLTNVEFLPIEMRRDETGRWYIDVDTGVHAIKTRVHGIWAGRNGTCVAGTTGLWPN